MLPGQPSSLPVHFSVLPSQSVFLLPAHVSVLLDQFSSLPVHINYMRQSGLDESVCFDRLLVTRLHSVRSCWWTHRNSDVMTVGGRWWGGGGTGAGGSYGVWWLGGGGGEGKEGETVSRDGVDDGEGVKV